MIPTDQKRGRLTPMHFLLLENLHYFHLNKHFLPLVRTGPFRSVHIAAEPRMKEMGKSGQYWLLPCDRPDCRGGLPGSGARELRICWPTR